MSEKETYIRTSVEKATKLVLEEHNLTKYRLSKILGVQPIMVTNYLQGKVRSASPRVAKVFFDKFNILLDNFNNEQDLRLSCDETL